MRINDAERARRAMKTTTTMQDVAAKDHLWDMAKQPLTVQELACALYEGMPHVQNLAEKCARVYGSAGALTFFDMMGDNVQNFWRGIAKQIIDHSSHWKANSGSTCVLDEAETKRLEELPRVPERWSESLP